MRRIAIVGGGAAGLAAAVAAAETVRDLRSDEGGRGSDGSGSGSGARADAGAAMCETVVFEASDRVGRSILATGNGRCNFSNAHIDPALYRNSEFVAEALNVRSDGGDDVSASTAAHDFFAQHGLLWRQEGEGRQYPATGKASTVLDVLRASMAACGVREACGAAVSRIELPSDVERRFVLRMADGSHEQADAVVLACGGAPARGLLPKSIPFVEPRAVLGPLAVREKKAIGALDGVRVKALVTLLRDGKEVASEFGEVLFRSYGVSGIAVFNLSRFAQSGDALELNLLAGIDAAAAVSEAAAEGFLRARRDVLQVRKLGATCTALADGMLLPAVARVVARRAGVDLLAPPDDAALHALVRLLVRFRLTVEGIGDARQCQVHRGGYAVEAFDPRACEARSVPGLFVVGEALDVDAPCGGFNLHWAWSSGLKAGRSAAVRVCG